MRDFPVSVSIKNDSTRHKRLIKNPGTRIRALTAALVAGMILSCIQISPPRAAEFDFISTEISKRDKIRDLIRISGMEATINRMIPSAVIQQFALVSSLRKDIPKSLLSDLADQTTLEMMDSKHKFLEALIPVYDRHMTDDEVTALLEIYKNPALASILKKIPALTHDSREVAKYWGRAVSDKVFRHLSDKLMHKGYKI